MGEYATYYGRSIKIGTCEEMIYLRFEDRDKVHLEHYNPRYFHGTFFRLPFPDEDHLGPGGYQVERDLPLFTQVNRWFALDELGDHPGTIQVSHPSGLLANVPCHHGVRLPEDTGKIRMFWNGKAGDFIRLSSLKFQGGESIEPVLRCRFCRKTWRVDWDTIWDYLPSWAQERFTPYREGRI